MSSQPGGPPPQTALWEKSNAWASNRLTFWLVVCRLSRRWPLQPCLTPHSKRGVYDANWGRPQAAACGEQLGWGAGSHWVCVTW